MEGDRRVVVGSAAGGLLGAAAFFAVDGLMPKEAEASATPYAVASRMCEMMNYVVSRNHGWDYVITEYTQGQMGTMSATFGPPRLGGLGGGIGYGLAHGIQAGVSLRNMRGKVFGLTSRMCPGGNASYQLMLSPIDELNRGNVEKLRSSFKKGSEEIETPITEGIIEVGVEFFFASEKSAELKRSGKND